MNTIKFISRMSSIALVAILSACTHIEDNPDGRTSDKDLFVTNRKTYAYMNHCYSWILNYGMNYI